MGKIELIDRFKMLERLQEWNTDDKQDSFLYSFALARIIEQPTVEAIPITEMRKMLRDCANKVSDSILDIVKEEYILKADYENRLKADTVAMLKELEYELYHALCHEIHGKEDCPCTNQTTSCLATFRVCDANRAIGKIIQQKINELEGEHDPTPQI